MRKQKEYPASGKPMFNPPYPGKIIKEEVIAALGLTVEKAAKMLDVDRVTLSRVINGKAGISVDMAMRLSEALGTSSEVWLRMQQSYDLWQAQQRKPDYSRVQRFPKLEDRPSA